MHRFGLKKQNEAEIGEQHQVNIIKNSATLESLDVHEHNNRTCKILPE
jgi:hypothetical protein